MSTLKHGGAVFAFGLLFFLFLTTWHRIQEHRNQTQHASHEYMAKPQDSLINEEFQAKKLRHSSISGGVVPKKQDGHTSISGRRYLTYDRTVGQYNNQIMSLEVAVCLAKMTNRTVAFGGFIRDQRMSSQKKLEDVSIPLSTFVDMDRIKEHNVPVVTWDMFKEDVNPKETVWMESYTHLPRQISSSKVNESMTVVMKSLQSNVTLIMLPRLFYWRLDGPNRCNLQDTEWYYNSVIPKKELREAADDFIRNNLKKPYAAIHYRRLEGRCHQGIDDIVQRIKNNTIGANITSFFLASDGDDRAGDEILRKTFNTTRVQTPLKGTFNSGIVDSYILSQASILFINPRSTMALNSILYNNYLHKLNTTVVKYTTVDKNGLDVC